MTLHSWALVVPMANEEADFYPFINSLQKALNELPNGKVYFVVDSVSKDKTLSLCHNHQQAG